MLGGLQWMQVGTVSLLEISLDTCLHGDSIYIADLRRGAALASYVSFVIKLLTIHPNMGPAQ